MLELLTAVTLTRIVFHSFVQSANLAVINIVGELSEQWSFHVASVASARFDDMQPDFH
jgi:hypothetical protein